MDMETTKKLMALTHRAELAELSLKHLQDVIVAECDKGDPIQAVRALRDKADRYQKEADRLARCLDADTATRHGRALASYIHGAIGVMQDEQPDSPIVKAYWFFMATIVD